MAKLVYSAIHSLDGYVADEDGGFGWAEPDEEVHSFINELQRGLGTCLYGRRMYEVLVAWETIDVGDQQPHIREFAEAWRAAEKVVYSRTLEAPSSARTRIERDFDPAAVSRMKDSASRDMAVAGPTLASRAFEAGLVDECQLFVAPAIVGGGTRALPSGVRLDLELLDERRFDDSGIVYMRYRVRP